MTSKIKESRKRKQPVTYRSSKEKRKVASHDILGDFERGLSSSPELTIVEDPPSKGPSRRHSGTEYDQHRRPEEFTLLTSYKIPRKQSTLDLTTERQERSVTPPTSHTHSSMAPPTSRTHSSMAPPTSRTHSSMAPPTSRTHSSMPSNKTFIGLLQDAKRSSNQSSVSTSSECSGSLSHGASQQKQPSSAHLLRNSMDSSLPPVVKPRSGANHKPRESRRQPLEFVSQTGESKGQPGEGKSLMKGSKGQPREVKGQPGKVKGQTNKETLVIDIDSKWDDTCLGLENSNASFTSQSPEGSQNTSMEMFLPSETPPTQEVVSLEREDDSMSSCSSDSLPAYEGLINSGGKRSVGRSPTKSGGRELGWANDNNDVMTIDSQSDDDAPAVTKTPSEGTRHRVTNNGGVSSTHTMSRFLPPRASPRKTASQGDARLMASFNNIVNIAKGHTGSVGSTVEAGSVRASESDRNSSSHSNVFAKKSTPSSHGNQDDKAPLTAHKPSLAGRIPSLSPSLSKEDFTIEVSAPDRAGRSNVRESGQSGKHGSVFSKLEREPLKSSSQTGGKAIAPEAFYDKEWSSDLFGRYPNSTRSRAQRRSTNTRSTSTAGVLSSFGVKKPLQLRRTRQCVDSEEDEEVSLRGSTVQIGRLKSDRVLYVELNKETLCVKFDYKGHTETVRVPLNKRSAWQMHLGSEPYLISVIIESPLEAKRIAADLTKRYLLDSDFYDPESSDESERYILLTLEEAPSPQDVTGIVEIMKSAQALYKICFDQDLSTEEAKKLLADASPSKPVRSKSGPLSKQEVKRALPTQPSSGSFGVRRSLRTRKPPTKMDPSSPICMEEPQPLVRKRPNVKILTYNVPAGCRVNIEVSSHDVDTLAPGEYLNDKVVDFYLRYMWYEKLPESLRPKVHIFSSFFHTRLKDASRDNKQLNTPERMHNRVKTWTRRVDLFDKEYIILPVCDRAHWFVAFVYQAGKFDPGQEKAIKEEHKKRAKRKSPKKSPKQAVVMETTSEERTEVKEVEPHPPGGQTEGVGTKPPTVSGALQQIALDYQDAEQPVSTEQSVSAAGMDFIGVPFVDDQEEDGVALSTDEARANRQEATKDEDDVIRDGPPRKMGDSPEPVVDMTSQKDVITFEGPVVAEEIVTTETSDSNLTNDSGTEEEESESRENVRSCVLVLDSLGVRRTGIVKTIRNYLTVEWKEKKGHQGELSFELLPVKYPPIPLQNNSSDCGVFMLQYVESLLQRMEEGLPYPNTSEGWASYTQTGTKREEIEKLIHRLGKEQTNSSQTTDKPES